MVIVDVAGVPLTGTGCGLKEHTGGSVTSGLIDAHDKVIPVPLGVLYPLIGFTLITPWAPLPAGTLPGATAVCTVMVNCAVTESTVKFCDWVIVVAGEV